MSASEPPTPDDIASEFPVSPDEAIQIADALAPIQRLTGVGDSVGATLEEVPGPGNRLAGTLLRNAALQVGMVSQSAELAARIIDFYITAQGGAVEDLFPPPQEVLKGVRGDFEPATNLFEEQLRR